jgi:hypothetical protein
MSKGIGGHQSANMKTDEWLTDPSLIKKLGEFDLDPCSPIIRPWDTAKHHYNILDNGLRQNWYGRIWLNPPYGKQADNWLSKLAYHNNGIALIFARTETEMFFEHVWNKADSILFIKGRLYFYTPEGKRAKANGGAPSVLVAYGENNVDALEDSGIQGRHVPLNQPTLIIVGVSPSWVSVVKIAINNFGDEDMKPIYEMVERIAPDKVAKNPHWKEKVRQSIQKIRRKTIKPTYCQATLIE